MLIGLKIGNLQQLRLFRIRTWFPFHWECVKKISPKRRAMALSFLVIWHKPNTKLVIQSYLFFSTPPISPTIFPHNKHSKLPFTPKSPPPLTITRTNPLQKHQNVGTCLRHVSNATDKTPRTVKALYQYHFCNFTPHYPTSKKNRWKSDFNGWNRCHLPPPTTHKKFNLWKFVLIRG